MRTIAKYVLGGLVLVTPAGVACAGAPSVRPSCHAVALGAGWDFERVDDQVGQWYAPGDVLVGWSTEEDSTIWTSRVCAVDDAS